MGARGPIPERESNLARPRERKGSDEQVVKQGELKPISLDWQPDPEWGQLADMTWESAKVSGMASFYQDTDYATLWFICQELDRYTKPKLNKSTGELYIRQSPEMVKSILAGLNSLGFDEGSRRRVRIELEPPAQESKSAEVIAFELYSGMLDDTAQTPDEPEGDSEEEAATE